VDHSGGEQTIGDWAGLLSRAASVRVLSSSLRILENIKIQQKGPDFGIAGEISYGGNLTEFLPYILAARGIGIHKSYVGNYMTSLDMAGFSVTLLRLDDELANWLDAPADTAAWKQ